MNTLLSKILVSVTLAVSLSLGASALADDASPTPAPSHHKHHKHMKKVFEACAQASQISTAQKGWMKSLDSSDRAKIFSCVKEFRQNMHTCLQDSGVTRPEPGQKPTDADKAAFKQCSSKALAEISGTASN